MKFTIQSAKNPVRVTPNSINLIVKFREFPDELEFTASEDDCEEHGKTLYANAVQGLYGQVIES